MPDPEPWPEPVDGQLLLDQLAGTVRQMAVLPRWAPEALALFTPHTYAFRLRDVSTYVGVESPEKRCGKTTLLGVLGKLVNRPILAANISSSAFFRVIEEMQPTLLIDEADTFLKKRSELKGILNAGYTLETAYVVRVAPEMKSAGSPPDNEPPGTVGMHERQNRGSRLVRFSCFCPKAIASIGRLPETLADRCIVIRMQRKTPNETCERLNRQEANDLRRKCARFVQDHAEAIAQARPQMPLGLADRSCDIFEPLAALAELAGGEWPENARKAAVGLSLSVHENNPIGSLFLDLLVLFAEAKADRLFSRTIVAGLSRFVDRPWGELRRGKEITEQWLARQVRPYGVYPRTFWAEGVSAKGYAKEDFKELFKRYIPQSEIEALLAEDAEIKQQSAGTTPENSGAADAA